MNTSKKRNLIVGVVAIVLLIVIGVLAFLLFKPSNSDDLNNSNNGEESNSKDNDGSNKAETNKEFKTFVDLLKSNKNIKCEWTEETDGTNFNGTIYVSNGMMRQSFSDSEDNNGEILLSGNSMYIWEEESAQGIKMSTESDDESALDELINDYSGLEDFDLSSDNTSIKCDDWKADNSLFEVPTNVEFMDYDLLQQQIEENTKNLEGLMD